MFWLMVIEDMGYVPQLVLLPTSHAHIHKGRMLFGYNTDQAIYLFVLSISFSAIALRYIFLHFS